MLGPGCSSLGFGAFMEHGPFQPGENGQLISNRYSWNLASNMLYVESPIGVGFSYSNTSEDYNSWNDTLTAEDNLMFIVNWLEEFPEYKSSDLFLTGESYAGHYIPQLAALILEHNKQPNITSIKLKAIALGNPLLDIDISVNAADYLWSHGAISDETLKLERTVCNDTTKLSQQVHQNLSKGCINVFNKVAEEMGDVDDSDLLLPECLTSTNAEQFTIKGKYASIHTKVAQRNTAGDPCISDRIFTYLNRPDVQKALHANITNLPYSWDFCRGPLQYQQDNLDMNIIPLVSNLIRSGIPVMLFSGDQDAKIPLTQTRIIANMLAKDSKLTPFTKYGPWYNKKQIGGWAQSFSAVTDGKNVTYLTYATVRGAAHEVPFTSPSQALTLFRAFLAGSPLPSK
ncbi:Serine carboxypeptidase-like [Thalictrum thalictroides]|uniref:Carboxypeptidase n=1 Tax=Thalictrum thalictroides TaxID=46969 RepID=A0A7J6V8I5_THATH|nr:Serine carboxypeptidase-like [Thalictrum thalictroides]